MHFKLAPRSVAASIVSLAALAFASRAHAQSEPPAAPAPAPVADEKASCIDAFDQAQRERAEAHLLSAQQHLLECTRPACGSSLMSECTQMYSDIERAVPSVVLSASDEATSTDLTAVEVTLNAATFAASLDGRPIAIDPGEYEFVFSAPGHEPVKRRVVIGTGEKYRAINVVFPDPNAAARASAAAEASAPAVTQPAVTPPLAAEPHVVPVMSWVLGGVAVVGVGTGAVLRLVANSDFDAMTEGCAARGCPESDIDTLGQKFLMSNVAFGVGAAAAAGAVLWYVLDAPSAEQGTLAILPAPDGRGAFATAQGRF